LSEKKEEEEEEEDSSGNYSMKDSKGCRYLLLHRVPAMDK